MNKKGFTLIELIVSIVLVSVILVALIGSLLQLRNAYSVVHENSDVIVYTSSISRVINSDINDNNGIKYVSCEPSGKKCSIILGNDERRELLITDNDKIIDDTELEITHSNNKTTLKYLNTTKYDKTNNENDKTILYIRTLEVDKYENSTTQVTTTKGYGFYDMSATQYEYFEDEEENNIEAFTTITIRLLDGINMDVSKYDITLYGAGRYDYSNYIGRVYRIDLDNSESDTAGTTSIDEVFGVGYFASESAHTKSDRITRIDIPTKGTQAFLGYYYKPYGVNVETKVIDSGGNIVASSRLFKNDVKINEELTGRVYAKWGECESGFKVEEGKCIQEEYTVTLNQNKSGKVCNSVGTTGYTVLFQNLVDDVVIPECEGYTFEGYFSSSSKQYHDRNGNGISYYDIASNATFDASWNACSIGQYSLMSEQACTDCIRGSYTNTSASGRCSVCSNGKTTNGDKQTSCNADCTNSNEHVATWKEATWNENNTITNECKIDTCKTGYDGELSSNKCTVNTYYIAFSLDGGKLDGSTNPSTLTVNYDETVTITNPKRAGYEFTGWTFNGNTGTAIHGSSAWTSQNSKTKDTTFKNLTATDEATVTLTANWSGCGPGEYNSGNSTTCSSCSAGTKSTGNANTSCTACGSGKWSSEGSSSCSNIDAGCYGTSASSSCPNKCSGGTYSGAKAGSCTACGAGKWSNKKSTGCSDINAGCYGTSASSACPNSCAKGTWSSSGKESCTNCPSSYPDTASTGSTSRTQCRKSNSCSISDCDHSGCSVDGIYYESHNCTTSTCLYSGCSCSTVVTWSGCGYSNCKSVCSGGSCTWDLPDNQAMCGVDGIWYCNIKTPSGRYYSSNTCQKDNANHDGCSCDGTWYSYSN